jgi:hypothetical protein
MQAKMTQLNKQMSLRAREGFHAIYWLTVTGMRLITIAFYPIKILPCSNSDLFWSAFVSVVCGSAKESVPKPPEKSEQDYLVK